MPVSSSGFCLVLLENRGLCPEKLISELSIVIDVKFVSEKTICNFVISNYNLNIIII
jgi:hypothetical protein